jgi:peptidoglycan/LPS O-acetylase OafA/YrhL
LNGLRFFAALAVVVHHVEQIKWFQNLPNFWRPGIFVGLGDQGVNFFFALSGFLITFLLYREQSERGRIDFKHFYLRRALRIWPLYYTITFLGFFIFPQIQFLKIESLQSALESHFVASLVGYLLMSAHIVERYIGPVAFASALWSTSVEEHFYLIWPALLSLSKKRFHLLLISIIAIWAAIRYATTLEPSWSHSSQAWKALKEIDVYLHFFRIDCMAMGGLGAWVFLNRPQWPRLAFSIPVQLVIYGALIYRLMNDMRMSPLANEYNCFLFVLIIFNVISNPRSLVRLENRVLDFLGKISFGIYAFNWVGITAWINLMRRQDWIPSHAFALNVIAYSGSFAVVGVLASASYFLIENPFLRLKKRFSESQDSMTTMSPGSADPNVHRFDKSLQEP